MLKLCGFALSNYYNKAKLALLEKGIPFEEELVWGGDDPAFLQKSPLGKIPYLETGAGAVSESQAIVEYLEVVYPEVPLLPGDPFAAAKVREIIMFSEFYLEWEARRLYAEAFFGGKVSDEVKEGVGKRLRRALAAFRKLTALSPYAYGHEFTLADCALAVHLPLVGSATKAIYGEDWVADHAGDYVARMAQRPTMKRILADRKANMAQFTARNSG